MTTPRSLEERAHHHRALGDTIRLAIVDELHQSDRSPHELQQVVGIASNLLAHHLDILESAGLITRSRSSGDGRRRYVHLRPDAFEGLFPTRPIPARGAPSEALFLCTHNSARSQLAAALWRGLVAAAADSSGTHPAPRVSAGTRRAAQRAGLDLGAAIPKAFDRTRPLPPIVVTVCDRAHEELTPDPTWLHWSIPDPVAVGTDAAFDETVTELRRRIHAIAPTPPDV